ncbi:MAG TPA: hypothetical protein DCZ69_08780 [Syntrophobacteraceae bacterium]|nr:hypothetical protein [Syntrophobacteraceae bacterium]
MTREDMIQKLKQIAPIVTQVTATYDMGFEFSVVVPNGVIYAEPGMLLDYSGGEWPPNEWEDKTDEEFEVLLRDFLLDETWQVTAGEDLSNEEIEQWLEDAQNTKYGNLEQQR